MRPGGRPAPAGRPCPPAAHSGGPGQRCHPAVPGQRRAPLLLPLGARRWATPPRGRPEPATRYGGAQGTHTGVSLRSWGDVGRHPRVPPLPQARSCTSPASSPLKLASTSAPAATYGTATPAALRSSSPVGRCHRAGGDTQTGTEWGEWGLSSPVSAQRPPAKPSPSRWRRSGCSG